VREEPGGKVDAGLLPREEPDDLPEVLHRHDRHILRNRENLCPPVGSLRRVVALPRYGPVGLPYPGGVVVCRIDRHAIV